MQELIWFKDPSVLFTSDTWMKFVPTKDMNTAESLNSVVRFATYFSLILYFCTTMSGYLYSIPVVMITTLALYKLFPNGTVIEAFLEKTVSKKETMPTKENPFMNVLLTEIQDNPDRPDAASNNRRDVKAKLNKAFSQTTDIHMDTTDAFDQAQAMRTFHTLQSSMVPNDLDGFKKFLAKGQDAPDYSSAFPSRNAKIHSEGYVSAKGSLRLPNSTDKLVGTSPSSFLK